MTTSDGSTSTSAQTDYIVVAKGCGCASNKDLAAANAPFRGAGGDMFVLAVMALALLLARPVSAKRTDRTSQ